MTILPSNLFWALIAVGVVAFVVWLVTGWGVALAGAEVFTVAAFASVYVQEWRERR